MKTPKCAFSIPLALLLSLGLALPVVAQNDEASPEKDRETTKELLQQIHQQMADGEWADVSDLMTEQAWDGWCERLVVECLSVSNIEMDFAIPGFDESQEAIREALKKHGLDKIEVAKPSVEVRLGDSEPEEKDEAKEAEARQQAEAQSERVLAALDKQKDRLAVIKSLWEARTDSPFSVSVFSGKIETVTSEDGQILAKVTPGIPQVDSGRSDIRVQMVVPPVFIKVTRVDDQWKFAGIDKEKTAEAMKNFRPPTPDAGLRAHGLLI